MKVYIVNSVEYGGYDCYEVAYHLSKKGAYRNIMAMKYENWMRCGYVQPGSYDDIYLFITERDLHD